MITELKRLWKQAFGDPDTSIDLFFRHGYSPERCAYLSSEGRVMAALYWFDCCLAEKKWAYLYAIATDEAYRNQGLCRRLMTQTHEQLRSAGYAGAILVPGSKELFSFYKKLGYRTCCHVTETVHPAAVPVPLRSVGQAEYAALRKALLPEGGMVQEGNTLDYLSAYARFYAGDGFVLAAGMDGNTAIVHELLGRFDGSGVAAALGADTARIRTPGNSKPFAMYYPLTNAPAPSYFGLALD